MYYALILINYYDHYVLVVLQETFQLTLKYTLIGHTFGVAYLAWSPDDHYLLALGPEESSEFWLWDTHVSSYVDLFFNNSS